MIVFLRDAIYLNVKRDHRHYASMWESFILAFFRSDSVNLMKNWMVLLDNKFFYEFEESSFLSEIM